MKSASSLHPRISQDQPLHDQAIIHMKDNTVIENEVKRNVQCANTLEAMIPKESKNCRLKNQELTKIEENSILWIESLSDLSRKQPNNNQQGIDYGTDNDEKRNNNRTKDATNGNQDFIDLYVDHVVSAFGDELNAFRNEESFQTKDVECLIDCLRTSGSVFSPTQQDLLVDSFRKKK